MKIHLLTGFLGSGKTTAIRHAASILANQGKRIGVIANDQGTRLVDGDFYNALKIPNRQVVNGCFCCNYSDLDSGIQSLIETNNPDIIFAESVGSCTDIVATVFKPLLTFRPEVQTTVSTFTDVRLLKMIMNGNTGGFDKSVIYIYEKQLEEAGVIVLNKIDLVKQYELKEIVQLVNEKYNDKILLLQNSQDETSIRQWIKTLDEYPVTASLESLQIDYDMYAAGEAKLAWLDQYLEIVSNNNNALAEAELLINAIYKRIKDHNYPVAHLKFLVDNKTKVSFTSNSQRLMQLQYQPAQRVPVLINIRVQTDPRIVSRLVADAIRDTEGHSGCKIIVSDTSAFQPGYPKPEHRMA